MVSCEVRNTIRFEINVEKPEIGVSVRACILGNDGTRLDGLGACESTLVERQKKKYLNGCRKIEAFGLTWCVHRWHTYRVVLRAWFSSS